MISIYESPEILNASKRMVKLMESTKHGGTWKVFEVETLYQGELHIDTEKRVVALELLIPAKEGDPAPSPPYTGKIPYICGTLFSGAKVTLYNCETEGEHRHVGQFTRQMIYADYAFWGLSVSTKDEIVFSRAYLEFGDILAWARLCDYHWDFSESGEVNLIWKKDEPVRLELNEDTGVMLYPSQGNVNIDRYAGEVTVKQAIIAELSYDEPVQWERILDDARCLQYLIGLGTGRQIDIVKAEYCHASLFRKVPQQDGTIKKIETEAEVLIGIPKTQTMKGKREFEYLFILDDIKNTGVLTQWCEHYEKLKPVLDLYFAAFSYHTGSAETLFLNLVQALETFHARFITNDAKLFPQRVLDLVNEFCKGNGNEAVWMDFLLDEAQTKNKKGIHLRSRLADLAFANGVLPFWPNGQLSVDYIRKVVDTRNYYTHYSLDQQAKAFHGEELLLVNSQLLALLEYHLLVLLGFASDKVRARTVQKINRAQTAHDLSTKTHKIEKKQRRELSGAVSG